MNIKNLIYVEDEKDIEGLGDIIAKITKSVGIKPCDKCEKRRKWLNEMMKKYKKFT